MLVPMHRLQTTILASLFFVLPLSAFADTGVGIIVGDPTGISALFGERVAMGVAWDIDDYLHVHADLWFVKGTLIDPVQGYVGVGGKLEAFDVNARGRDDDENDVIGVGVRVPFGAQWYFHPEWELFGEIVPGIGIIPDTDFDIDAGIGVRYHF